VTILFASLLAVLLGLACIGWALREPAVFVSSSDYLENERIDPGMLETHVRMISEELGPRDFSNLEGLARVAEYIASEFRKGEGRVRFQPYLVGSTEYKNVIAEFGPDTEERIVVGAHYDSAGPLPGADDNASGIAGLLAIAEKFKKRPPTMKVELVAYCLEEPPYFRTESMGSAVHAKRLKDDGQKIRAMFSLEMLGYFSDEANSQAYPSKLLNLFYPSVGNFMTVVSTYGQDGLGGRIRKAMAATSSLPFYSITAPKFLVGIDFSDHMNYWNNDYPAVMITDTSFYRNKNYHSAFDTADTLDYVRMAETVKGVWNAVIELCNKR
jgi:Zn-dependent M28 family amino/carboxypeptidase